MKKIINIKKCNGGGVKPLFNKNYAFTLAEVLITLGIIGVVAAMTITSLIANVNSTKFRSQFKKTLASINQANRLYRENNGVSLSDTVRFNGRSACIECASNGNSTV